MAKRLESLKGLRATRPLDQLDSSRYDYLSIDQAEPNFGVPAENGSLVTSNTDGTRGFTKNPLLNGLQFENGELQDAGASNYVMAFFQEPDAFTGHDSVGWKKLSTIATGADDDGLQLVTEVSNWTYQGINILGSQDSVNATQGYGLIVSSPGGIKSTGSNLFGGSSATDGATRFETSNVEIGTGAQLKYGAPVIIDNTLLVLGSQDSVGQREAQFAFVAPTLNQVLDQSFSVNNEADSDGVPFGNRGASLNVLKLKVAPPNRASVDARQALVWTGTGLSGGGDSVGYRELRDLAVTDSTTDAINVWQAAIPGTASTVLSSGDKVYMLVFDSVSSDFKNVRYAEFDFDDLTGEDENLHTVTARQEPGFDIGETGNEAIFSGGVKLRSTPAGNTRNALVLGNVSSDSAIGVRTITEIAVGDSTSSSITTNGINVVGGSLNVDVLTTLDSTTVDGQLTVNGLAQASNLEATTLTQGRVVYTGANGRLLDDGNLTFNGTTLDNNGLTRLDSTEIDATDNGLRIINIDSASYTKALMLDDATGYVAKRQLAASAFTAPDLQQVTAVGDSTNLGITTAGITTTALSTFNDSVIAKSSVKLQGLAGNTSLRVLVLDGDSVAYQDISQEAVSGETLHTATSQGRTTSNQIGAQAVYIYDKSGFSDNNSLSEFNIVVDSDRNFYVQDKIFFNDLSGGADQRFLNSGLQGDRNFIRFTDPAFAGYPGIYDFISDDSDDAASVGNALLRAGGLILTDSATVGTNLTVTGDFTVNGTTTYVNTTQLNISDKDLVIAFGAATEAQTAGAGIKIADSDNPYASFTYDGAGSWVSDVNLTVDSDLIVNGASTLNGAFASNGGLILTNVAPVTVPENNFNVLAVGGNDSVGTVELSSAATVSIESFTWDAVLGYGDSTGLNNPYIKNGFRVDSATLGQTTGPYGADDLRVMILNSSNDSVAVRTLGTASNLAANEITLDYVTTQNPTTSNTVTVAGLNLTSLSEFGASEQNALFIGAGDSVGFRDLGDLAFLDSDGETLASVTSKTPGNNIVTAEDLSFPNLRLRNLYAKQVDIGLMLDGDSVVTRQLASSAFLPQDLQDVTTTGANRHFDGHRDSTDVRLRLDGGLMFGHTPIVAGSEIADKLDPQSPNYSTDFYQMLIINSSTDSVARGNIPTIVQTTVDTNLQEITANGASQNNSTVDSTTVDIELAGDLYLTRSNILVDSVSSSNVILVLDTNNNNLVGTRSLDQVLETVTFHDTLSAGRFSSQYAGTRGYYLWNKVAFTDNNLADNHYVVIDSEAGGFFSNVQIDSDLNVDGLTTLDSTTIDGTLTVNDRAELGDIGFPVRIENSQVSVTGKSLTLQGGSHSGIDRPRIVLGNNANTSFGSNSGLGPDVQFYSGRGELQFIGGDVPGQGGAVTIATMDSANFNVNVLTTLDSTTIDAGGRGFILSNLIDSSDGKILTISNTGIVSQTDFSDFYQVPSLQTVTEVGDSTNREITALGFIGDSATLGTAQINQNLNVDGLTTLDSTTIADELLVDGKLVVANGNTFPQTRDMLYIGGDNLDGTNASIYLGNRGDDTGYGWRFFYEGSGNANLNKLIIRSENLGSPVDALTFTQDGAAVFDNTVTAANLETSGNLNVDGLTTLDSTTVDGSLTVQTDKLQLQSGVQFQDAAGTNLVIYDSSGAVLWGNV